MADGWRYSVVVTASSGSEVRVQCPDVAKCREVVHAELSTAEPGAAARLERRRGRDRYEQLESWRLDERRDIRRVFDMHAIWARRTLDDVRAAFKRASRARGGVRLSAKSIDKSVRSTYLPPMRDHWIVRELLDGPDPFTVVVLTENGLPDPMTDQRTYAFYDRVASALRADPVYEEVEWASYNPAVQYFWLKPVLGS